MPRGTGVLDTSPLEASTLGDVFSGAPSQLGVNNHSLKSFS
ncbi:MAG TPA: hypothetical protein VGI33_06580 [Paenibacillus sp.]|jgi:hypothetical protein